MLETAAIFIVLSLYINRLDRNVEIKSSAGSFPSSLVHLKHSQDWVIRGEFVARIRTGNPFRCAVTDHSYSALGGGGGVYLIKTLSTMTLVLRFIAEGVATRDGVCAYDSFFTSKFLKKQMGCYACEKTDWLRLGLAVLDSKVKARCISCQSPSGFL